VGCAWRRGGGIGFAGGGGTPPSRRLWSTLLNTMRIKRDLGWQHSAFEQSVISRSLRFLFIVPEFIRSVRSVSRKTPSSKQVLITHSTSRTKVHLLGILPSALSPTTKSTPPSIIPLPDHDPITPNPITPPMIHQSFKAPPTPLEDSVSYGAIAATPND